MADRNLTTKDILQKEFKPAILAATLAMGKPVAFEARADERDTRGFTSMM